VNLTDQLGPVSPGLAALAPDAGNEGLGAGAVFTVGAALTGMTLRQAETLILLKQIRAAVGGGTDVAAIAAAVVAAIVPHLADAVNPDAIAAAVVAAVETHAPGTVDPEALAALVVSHIATALGNG
jgi:hypothetical protein